MGNHPHRYGTWHVLLARIRPALHPPAPRFFLTFNHSSLHRGLSFPAIEAIPFCLFPCTHLLRDDRSETTEEVTFSVNDDGGSREGGHLACCWEVEGCRFRLRLRLMLNDTSRLIRVVLELPSAYTVFSLEPTEQIRD